MIVFFMMFVLFMEEVRGYFLHNIFKIILKGMVHRSKMVRRANRFEARLY